MDVLDSFNMVYRDEYSILDQKYQSKNVQIFIMMTLIILT